MQIWVLPFDSVVRSQGTNIPTISDIQPFDYMTFVWKSRHSPYSDYQLNIMHLTQQQFLTSLVMTQFGPQFEKAFFFQKHFRQTNEQTDKKIHLMSISHSSVENVSNRETEGHIQFLKSISRVKSLRDRENFFTPSTIVSVCISCIPRQVRTH